MSTINGVSENKAQYLAIGSIVAPIGVGAVINQGDRVKLVSGFLQQTTAISEDWIGVADFQNPVASLGDVLSFGKILLAPMVCMFDAPATETFNFGDQCYAYADGLGYYYPQAVTKSTSGTPKLVGTFVGANGTVGGTGVKVAVKIAPTLTF